MSVTLNGHVYDISQFVGYGYLGTNADTGLIQFPNSIFSDMLAELAGAAALLSLSPSTAGNVPISTGTTWVRSLDTGQFAKLAGVILGTDPTGAQLLRVGGTSRLGGNTTVDGWLTWNGTGTTGLGASRGILSHSAGQTAFISNGVDASTNGSFVFQTRRSDDSNSITWVTVAASGSSTFPQAVAMSTTLALGSSPANSGTLRLPTGSSLIMARNAANSGNITLMELDGSNHVLIDTGALGAIFGGTVTATGFAAGTHDRPFGNNAADGTGWSWGGNNSSSFSVTENGVAQWLQIAKTTGAVTIATQAVIGSGLTVSAGTTAVQALNVGGTTSWAFSGADKVALFGVSQTTYTMLSFNNDLTASGGMGVMGKGGSDLTLYLRVPSSGAFAFTVNGSVVASVGATGQVFSTLTGSVPAFLAGDGTTANATFMRIRTVAGTGSALEFVEGTSTILWDVGKDYNAGTRTFTIRDVIGGRDAIAITSNTSAVRMSAYGAGAATFDASGNITSVSDESWKSEIAQYATGLRQIRLLVPIIYNFAPHTGLDQVERYTGFSAQNVRLAMPENVFAHWETGVLSIWDRGILAATVNAIQELADRQDVHGSKILSLNDRVSRLEGLAKAA